jgi:amidase
MNKLDILTSRDTAMQLKTALSGYDALGLAELVRRKETHAEELLGWAIENLETVNPRLNCIAHTHYEEARAQIAAGLAPGAFRGVPFILKDLGIDLAGTVTSCGSRAFQDYRPSADSELAARYKRAGLVIFAKSTTPELGLAYTTESKAFGLTRNPWNAGRSAGGSSGGAAAAVAGGIVPMAHASDGGGSIRVPASCNGLFGLKPSRGRMPSGPQATERWLGLAISHAVTVSVRDSAALLDATCGMEPGSRYCAPQPPADGYLHALERPPQKLRIALMTNSPTGTPVDPECTAAARHAAKLCEALGHRVEEAAPELDSRAMTAGFLTVVGALTAQTLRDRGTERGTPVSPEELETVTSIFWNRGREASGLALADANDAFQAAAIAMANFLSSYDVLLAPALARPPAPLGVLGLSPVDLAAYTREVTTYNPFTALANMTGQPSMSVPLFWTSDGLPVGALFTGRYGEESTLLGLAVQLEQAQPWAPKRADNLRRQAEARG